MPLFYFSLRVRLTNRTRGNATSYFSRAGIIVSFEDYTRKFDTLPLGPVME